MTTLSVAQIRTDGGTQPRAEISPNIVEEYADLMTEGLRFPPITVFYDGEDYWLADGFHRIAAANKIELLTIRADVNQGNRRDAILYSVGANSDHGLRRTNADKHRAVMLILEDEEWLKWSDREIAKKTNTHHTFVGKIRKELTGVIASEKVYTTKHGTTATMNTENIGRKPPSQPKASYTKDDLPGEDEEELFEEDRYSSNAENTTEDITSYIEIKLKYLESDILRHEVVHNIIKNMKALVNKYQQESSG